MSSGTWLSSLHLCRVFSAQMMLTSVWFTREHPLAARVDPPVWIQWGVSGNFFENIIMYFWRRTPNDKSIKINIYSTRKTRGPIGITWLLLNISIDIFAQINKNLSLHEEIILAASLRKKVTATEQSPEHGASWTDAWARNRAIKTHSRLINSTHANFC